MAGWLTVTGDKGFGCDIPAALSCMPLGHLELLKNHIVKQFIHLRWKRFAWPIFLKNLVEFAFL